MSTDEWSGVMLNNPPMVEAFTTQLRGILSEQADYVARIRRDAEAMWRENPPPGYSSFEAWWRHRWVTGPFGQIQEHLEKAAELTFRLEARYRRGRHEIPTARQAAAQAKQAPALGSGASTVGQAARPGTPPPLPPTNRTTHSPQNSQGAQGSDGNFMSLIRRESA
jgi:hypothetical protein